MLQCNRVHLFRYTAKELPAEVCTANEGADELGGGRGGWGGVEQHPKSGPFHPKSGPLHPERLPQPPGELPWLTSEARH